MLCIHCGNMRLAHIDAKVTSFNLRVDSRGIVGDIPSALGIGGGDYLTFAFCLECGRIQSEYPLGQLMVNEILS